MKVNNLPRRVLNFMSDGTDRRQLTVIYLFALVATFVLLLFFAPRTTEDTPTYEMAANVFLSGGVDAFRTPVYPLLLRFSSIVVPQSPYAVIIALQLIVFYCSILYLYKLCGIVIRSRVLRFLVTMFYAGTPYFITWTMSIMTESLAISLLIMLCYDTLRNFRGQGLWRAATNFVLLLILGFMRPIFIFLIPIMALLWLYVALKVRRLSASAILNLVGLLVFSGLYLGYCKLVNDKHGFFATSCVSSINQYDILRNSGLVDVSLLQDVEKQAHLKQLMHNYDSIGRASGHVEEKEYIVTTCGIKAFTEFVSANIRLHFTKYVYFTAKKFVQISVSPAVDFPLYLSRSKPVATTLHIFVYCCSFTFGFLYLLLLGSGVFFVTLGARRRKVPVAFSFLWLIVTANVFAAIAGAPGAYARLIMPCMPLVLILVAMLVDAVTVRARNNYRMC